MRRLTACMWFNLQSICLSVFTANLSWAICSGNCNKAHFPLDKLNNSFFKRWMICVDGWLWETGSRFSPTMFYWCMIVHELIRFKWFTVSGCWWCNTLFMHFSLARCVRSCFLSALFFLFSSFTYSNVDVVLWLEICYSTMEPFII